MPRSSFDATNSLLGYIYQIRYGLLVSLEKMRDIDDPDDYFVSIESLDDIAFDKQGSPHEMLQTKYHSSPGNLNNRSPDIWKTIRVWIESFKNGQLDFDACTLFLITTETIGSGSFAELLSNNNSKRNPSDALTLSNEITSSKASKENEKAFNAFNSLTESEKLKLLKSIYILDNAENLVDIEKHLKKQLVGIVREQQLSPLLSRLEGRWFSTVIEVLEQGNGRICIGELVDVIDDLREQFLPSNLPDDYSSADVDELLFNEEDRTFIQQLKIIGAGDKLVKRAVMDFYRSSAQRTKWIDDGLLHHGELKAYSQKLVEEWELHMGFIEAKLELEADGCEKRAGLELYKVCQTEGAKPIRDSFSQPFFSRGSYHNLADLLEIGWHPEFKSLINSSKGSKVA